MCIHLHTFWQFISLNWGSQSHLQCLARVGWQPIIPKQRNISPSEEEIWWYITILSYWNMTNKRHDFKDVFPELRCLWYHKPMHRGARSIAIYLSVIWGLKKKQKKEKKRTADKQGQMINSTNEREATEAGKEEVRWRRDQKTNKGRKLWKYADYQDHMRIKNSWKTKHWLIPRATR